MNQAELRDTTKKFLKSPVIIVITVLMGLSIVADLIMMIRNGNFGIFSLAFNNIFTILYVIFLGLLLASSNNEQLGKSLHRIKTVAKVRMILSIIGLSLLIVTFAIIFVGFTVLSQQATEEWEMGEEYREVIEAFLGMRSSFGIGALALVGALVITIGFYSTFGGLLKDVRYATCEEGHFHKEKALAAVVWGGLNIALKVASIFALVMFARSFVDPISNLANIVDVKLSAEEIRASFTVDYASRIKDFVLIASLIALVVAEVLHLVNCSKLNPEKPEPKAEEPKEEEVQEAEVVEPKEEVLEEPKEE